VQKISLSYLAIKRKVVACHYYVQKLLVHVAYCGCEFDVRADLDRSKELNLINLCDHGETSLKEFSRAKPA
jgi:hypothetical protein